MYCYYKAEGGFLSYCRSGGSAISRLHKSHNYIPLRFLSFSGSNGRSKSDDLDSNKDDKKHDNQKKLELDHKEAESAILHRIHQVEAKVQAAIEDEVHAMFPDMDHESKSDLKQHVQTAVSRGSSKVMMVAEEHSKARLLPFLPKDFDDQNNEHHKVLRAMEAAEVAVLHAIQDEVGGLFHGTHPDHPVVVPVKKAQKSVQRGVQKATKEVQEHHNERQTYDAQAIHDYVKSSANQYRFCTGG